MVVLNTTTRSFPISDIESTKQKVLHWISQFSTFCFLDNNHFSTAHQRYECIAAANATAILRCSAGNALQSLGNFRHQHKGWLFGHFSYDLKNEIEALSSRHADYVGFPDLCFFVPEVVFKISREALEVIAGDDVSCNRIFQEIQNAAVPAMIPAEHLQLEPRFSRQEFIDTVAAIQRHIQRGDCYEVNFCQEFF